MKRISAVSIVLLSLFSLVGCKEEAISSLPKMEVQIGESFTINGPTEVNFTNMEGLAVTIEFRKFSDHLVKGLISPRTYVDVAVVSSETTTYQIETAYSDSCYSQGNRLCDKLRFQVNDQTFLLQFEEAFWSNPKENRQGVEYITIDSAQVIVVSE